MPNRRPSCRSSRWLENGDRPTASTVIVARGEKMQNAKCKMPLHCALDIVHFAPSQTDVGDHDLHAESLSALPGRLHDPHVSIDEPLDLRLEREKRAGHRHDQNHHTGDGTRREVSPE
jgi:hypothetical protein